MSKVSLPTNLEDIEAGGSFDALPADTYTLEIDNVEQKVSPSSGNDYLSMTLKVIDHEEFTGRKVWDNISLVEQALFKLKQISLSAGIDIATDFDTEDFLGAVVTAVVDQEPSTKEDEDGNPIMRNVVKYYVYK